MPETSDNLTSDILAHKQKLSDDELIQWGLDHDRQEKEQDTPTTEDTSLLKQVGKDTLAGFGKIAAGAVKGLTLGAVNPEEGKIRAPLTGPTQTEKAASTGAAIGGITGKGKGPDLSGGWQFMRPMAESMKELGVSPEVINSPYTSFAGEIVGYAVPFTAGIRVMNALTSALIMRAAGSGTALPALERGAGALAGWWKGVAALQRTADVMTANSLLSAVEAKTDGRDATEASLRAAKWGAGIQAGLEIAQFAVQAAAKRGGPATFMVLQKGLDDLSEFLFRKGYVASKDEAAALAAKTISSEIERVGGVDKLGWRDWFQVKRDLSKIRKATPGAEPIDVTPGAETTPPSQAKTPQAPVQLTPAQTNLIKDIRTPHELPYGWRTPREIERTFESEPFAIITATNPQRPVSVDYQGRDPMDVLVQDVLDAGFQPADIIPVMGKEENAYVSSIIVRGMLPTEAEQISTRHGQGYSILNNGMLEHESGKLTPRTGITFLKDPSESDYNTTLDDGHGNKITFTTDLAFGNEVQHPDFQHLAQPPAQEPGVRIDEKGKVFKPGVSQDVLDNPDTAAQFLSDKISTGELKASDLQALSSTQGGRAGVWRSPEDGGPIFRATHGEAMAALPASQKAKYGGPENQVMDVKTPFGRALVKVGDLDHLMVGKQIPDRIKQLAPDKSEADLAKAVEDVDKEIEQLKASLPDIEKQIPDEMMQRLQQLLDVRAKKTMEAVRGRGTLMDRIDRSAEGARNRLQKRFGGKLMDVSQAAIESTLSVLDLADIGVAIVANGVRDMGRFTSELMKRTGLKEVPQKKLERAYREAVERYDVLWDKAEQKLAGKEKLKSLYELGKAGANWYDKAPDALRDFVSISPIAQKEGIDSALQKFVNLNAALSIRMSPRRQIRMALDIWYAYNNEPDQLEKSLGQHPYGVAIKNARNALKGGELGKKTYKATPYKENLSGNLDKLTFDTRGKQIMGIPIDAALTEAQHRAMEEIWTEAAQEVGEPVARFQAATWQGQGIMELDQIIEQGNLAGKGARVYGSKEKYEEDLYKSFDQIFWDEVANFKKRWDEHGGFKLSQDGYARGTLNFLIARTLIGAAIGATEGDTTEERIRNALIGAGVAAVSPSVIKYLMRAMAKIFEHGSVAEVKDLLTRSGYGDELLKVFDPIGMKGPAVPPVATVPGVTPELAGAAASAPLDRWFSGSRVTDPSGNPLRVYHGTAADFKDFSPTATGKNSNLFGSWDAGRAGFFFSENPQVASSFAGNKEGANVRPAYLNIRNPLDLTSGDVPDRLFNQLEQNGINARYLASLRADEMWEAFDNENDGPALVEALKKIGYDGVILSEPGREGLPPSRTWVAFDKNQIRSAYETAAGKKEIPGPIEEKPIFDEYRLTPEQAKKFLEDQKSAIDIGDRALKIHWDRIDSQDKLENLVNHIYKMDKTAIEQARRGKGKQSIADMKELARKMGVPFDELVNRQAGGALDREQTRAVIHLLGASLKETAALIDELAANPDKKDLEDLFRHQLEVTTRIQRYAYGARAEWGRTGPIWGSTPSGYLKIASDIEAARNTIQPENQTLTGSTEKVTMTRLANMMKDLGFTKKLDEMSKLIDKVSTPGYGDMFLEAMYGFWFLSSPVTLSVNAITNAMNMFFSIPERALGAATAPVFRGLEQAGVLQPSLDHMTGREVAAYAYGMFNSYPKAVQVAAHAFTTGERSQAGGSKKIEMGEQAAITKENLGLSGPMGFLADFVGNTIRFSSKGLVATDEFFKIMNAQAEMWARAFRVADAQQAEGTDFAKAVVDRLKKMPAEDLQAARDFAAYQTFQDKLGPFGAGLVHGLNNLPWKYRIPAKMVVPFVRVSINIFKYAGERIPGMNFYHQRLLNDFNAGGARREIAMGRIIFGGALVATAAYLALQGKLTGHRNPNMRFIDQTVGKQQYSVVHPDGSQYRFDRLDPWGMVLGFGADWANIVFGNPDADVAARALASAIMPIAWNLTSKTYMSGISRLLKAIVDADKGTIVSFFKGEAGIAVPSIARQANRLGLVNEKTMKDTWTFWDRIIAQTPGASDSIPPWVDAFGHDVYLPGGLGPDALSPIYFSKLKDQPQYRAILDNDIHLTPPGHVIEGFQLSPLDAEKGIDDPRAGIELTHEQAYKYHKLAGQRFEEDFKKLIQTEAWLNASQILKQDLANGLYQVAKTIARMQLEKEDPDLAEKVRDKRIRLNDLIRGVR